MYCFMLIYFNAAYLNSLDAKQLGEWPLLSLSKA